jgi:hypothetical protein
VLRRHDDRVDALRRASFILEGHLRFGIGTQIRHQPRLLLPDVRETLHELVRIQNRHGHEFRGRVGRIAEHDALVARAAGLHAAEDVGRLLMNMRGDAAGIRVETVFRIGVADFTHGLAHDFLYIDVRRRGNLAAHEHEARGGEAFAGDARLRIVGEDAVEHRVGNLIAHLIGVSL